MHLKGTSKFQNTKVTMLLEVEVLLTLFRRNSGVYYPACGPQQYTLDENSGESVKCRDQLDKQGFQKCDTAREWEMRHKNSEKSEDQWTNTAPRWRCWNWIQASFIILSAVNERRSGELNCNSSGLQGQRTKWSLTINELINSNQ